jgi:hypothetical protein
VNTSDGKSSSRWPAILRNAVTPGGGTEASEK